MGKEGNLKNTIMAAILEYDIWIGDTLGRSEELDGWWIGSLRHSQKT